MGFFTFRHSERDSELEKALQGIPLCPGIPFKFDGMGEDKQQIKETVSYILPVDCHHNSAYGFLTIEGRLSEALVGFVRKKSFLSKQHYHLDVNGSLIQTEPNDSILYLPLQLTEYQTHIGINEGSKFVRHEGSPFQVFGIGGSEGIRPLILVAETEEGIKSRGIYKNKGGEASTYNHFLCSSEKEIREFLRTLRGVKSTAGRRVLVETAQIGTGKAPEPAKSLEAITNGEINWEEPKSIVAYLDQYVVGQEDAKMIISVAFSNYMTKVRTQNEELHKDNLLLIGPSGVGKTYMVSLLAKRASLPMVQTKLTGKSTEGYKGENLSTVFEQMRAMTTGEAPYGVIFFDEIDKLARDEWGSGSGFGPRLQDELIGWVEEATVLADRKDEKKGYNGLNTRNILFVTAGAFQSTDKDSSLAGIILKRLGKEQKQIGFGVQQKSKEDTEEYVIPKVRPEDLITYGLKPELVGRLPSLGVLRPLTVDDKVRILTGTKRSSITNYTQLLSLKGYQVEIDSTVPEVIARYCPEETGARALNAVCNDLFTEIMFDPQRYADDKKVIRVTPELARKLINLYA